MLATVWSFTLWQPWQKGAEFLAKMFLDFEPGIHFSQWQMQAGMNGYHALRIYNPTTQFEQHDPEASFVKKWVPELSKLPVPQIYEPWKLTPLEEAFYEFEPRRDYPKPMVKLEQQHPWAKETYWKVRQSPAVQDRLFDIQQKLSVVLKETKMEEREI